MGPTVQQKTPGNEGLKGAMSKPQPQDGTEEEVRHIQKLKESLFSRNQTFASLKEFYTRIKILKK